MPPPDQFRYERIDVDTASGDVTFRYSTTAHTFVERYGFGRGGNWDDPAVGAAVRILFLLAGVSYYKTTAAPVIDLGELPSTAAERAFLTRYYVEGLGEFAFRNGLDLRDVRVVGPDAEVDAGPAEYAPVPGRPLIPFGGGIDSIVTVAALAADHPEAALFVMHPAGDRFEAIEDAAAVTGLPIAHVAREIDPLVRRSDELGFLNGHVPVTAIVTAAAVVAATLEGRDAVVLSNEWSASVPTRVVDGVAINHQWSKGDDYEEAFQRLAADAVGPRLSVFSYLRPRTELWVAQQFAARSEYHRVFRSCNRAFQQDPAARLDHWCGICDKCCFIDLVLSPYMARADLEAVFGGTEPLENPANEARFGALLGLGDDARPFECIGDVDECRAALLLAAERADRRDGGMLQRLRDEVARVSGAAQPDATTLLAPRGPHHIPERYAPADLLVRAR
ncbi:MAG TPA: hypothetical protein VGF51_09480 [Acidimicrobiales bacterium]|jgi:hypothetical protein